MHRSTWKRFEARVAKRLGTKRIPVTGERHGADLETPLLSVQVKLGRRRPSYLAEWLDGIRQTAQIKCKIGLVVWCANRERTGEGLVVMRLEDFEELLRVGHAPPVMEILQVNAEAAGD